MSKSSTIPELQNTKESIDMLAAASLFYALGKIALGVQVLLTVGLAISMAIWAKLHPNFAVWAAFSGITVTLLDVLMLDRLQIQLRKRGALAQEALDVALFGLKWNSLKCGEKLEPESVHLASAVLKKWKGTEKLTDWYPPSVGQLPPALANLVCQRACFHWDTALRRIYAWILVGVVAVAVFAIMALAIASGYTMEQFILALYAPVAPAVIWCVREARRHFDAGNSLGRARTFVEKTWDGAMSGELTPNAARSAARLTQDALFENRSKNPLVFNWIYKLLRTYNEYAMNKGAETLVAEALAAMRNGKAKAFAVE